MQNVAADQDWLNIVRSEESRFRAGILRSRLVVSRADIGDCEVLSMTEPLESTADCPHAAVLGLYWRSSFEVQSWQSISELVEA